MFRLAVIVAFVLMVAVDARAVTVRDIIELSKAGLPDEILTAVIDADRTIFTLDKDQILELKKAGVSEAVLLKMLRSRAEYEREAERGPESDSRPVPHAEPALPEVVVIGATPPPAVTIVVPQYYYVPFPIWGRSPHQTPGTPPSPFLAPEHRGFGRFINDGWTGR